MDHASPPHNRMPSTAKSSPGRPDHPPSPGESPTAAPSSSSSPEPPSATTPAVDNGSTSSENGSPPPLRTRVRRRRSITGERNPPQNEEGLLYCDRPECAARALTFPRRCEWNKHMDKHERPYRCGEPGCEKLRGFTYSGGLMRHEREVHRKHGGLKKALMCPHESCKRSSGLGFTRQENLNEHLRRVHQSVDRTEPVSDSVDDSKIKKRRRLESSDEPPDSPARRASLDGLHEEVQRLRHENADLKAELRGHRERLLRSLKSG